jgi:hypothetical protein
MEYFNRLQKVKSIYYNYLLLSNFKNSFINLVLILNIYIEIDLMVKLLNY